jgi:hypothetical protein
MCRPIIVLGAERSGTSVCAEMLQAWGAYLGEPGELPLGDALNPHGRLEWLPLWDLLSDIGDFASGASWWEDSFQEQVARKATDPRLSEKARGLVARMESRGRPWAWKDPALCHFLGFWKPFWVEPIFIVMVRHPADIAVSWTQFRTAGGLPETSLRCNLLRWQHMTLSVLRGTATERAKLFIEYERLTDAPSEQTCRLAAFVDEQCDRTTDETTLTRMAQTCESTLHRNRRGHLLDAEMTESQVSLYEFLRSKVTTPDRSFTEIYPMPANWRDLITDEEAR